MTFFKTVIGWICLLLLAVFLFTNLQSSSVKLLSVHVEAPMALVVGGSAVLGAFSASGFAKMLKWARGRAND